MRGHIRKVVRQKDDGPPGCGAVDLFGCCDKLGEPVLISKFAGLIVGSG
jgi:hypothetical protein